MLKTGFERLNIANYSRITADIILKASSKLTLNCGKFAKFDDHNRKIVGLVNAHRTNFSKLANPRVISDEIGEF